MLKKLLLLSLFLFSAVIFGAREGTPVSDRAAGASEEILSDGGSGIPGDPSSAMEEAVNIYIHVILRQPVGPPPPTFEIISADCSAMTVSFKSYAAPATYYGDWFNLYRRYKFPMYSMSDIDSVNMFITRSTIRYQFDMFTDALWPDTALGGNKGVCNDSVNYFWVLTTSDSTNPTTVYESAYPSNCVAEYDQLMIRRSTAKTNYITLPCYDSQLGTPMRATTLGTNYFGTSATTATANVIARYYPATQSWGTIASLIGGVWRVPTGVSDTLYLNDVLRITLTSVDDSVMFTTRIPGTIAEDRQYNFTVASGTSRSYWIMLPMRYTTYLKSIYSPSPRTDTLYLKHVATDLGAAYCSTIKYWNRETMTLSIGASRVGTSFVGASSELNKAFPGRAVYITFTSTKPDPWPPLF